MRIIGVEVDDRVVMNSTTGAILVTSALRAVTEAAPIYFWFGVATVIVMWLIFLKLHRKQGATRYNLVLSVIIAVLAAIVSGLSKSAIEWLRVV